MTQQSFVKSEIFEMGKTKMQRNNMEINIYSLERMLIELMRFRSKLPFDYYKEIKNADKMMDMIQMEVL